MENKQFTISFGGSDFRAFYINSVDLAEQAISQLQSKECLMSLDTETNPLPKYAQVTKAGLSPLLSSIRLLQICDGKNVVIFDLFYLPKEMFVTFLNSKSFVGHNAIFDLQFLMQLGANHVNIGCTLLAAKHIMHACYPTDEGLSFSLASLSEKLLKVPMHKELQVSNWSEPDLNFEQIEYAGVDAVVTLKLSEALSPAIKRYGLERIYSLSKAAQHPIAAMQLNGLGLDVERHSKLARTWADDVHTARKSVLEQTGLQRLTAATIGEYLETNLPKDVLTIWPRTETGRLSVDANTFADFSGIPIASAFGKYQKLETLTHTFGFKLLDDLSPYDHRIHAQYKLAGARTGRMSCHQPNLQNMPRDNEVRKNFIPAKGSCFVCADFSQIELRVAAELSRDAAMLNAYRNGIDLHALTGSLISKKRLKDVTKADRQMAKAFNFGLLFGLGAKKFSHYAKKSYGVDVSQEEATESIKIFRQTYAGYRAWQLRQADACGETLKVTTPCGKLRRLDPANSYGTSMNTPIQGGAAEVMLNSLIRVHKRLQDFSDVRLVNVVHDEVLLECLPHKAAAAKSILEHSMLEGYLDVFPNGITRNLVDAKIGFSWGEAK